MSRRFTVLSALVGVAAAIVVLAIAVSSGGGSSQRAAHVPGRDVTRIIRGIPQEGLRLGRPDAPVLLVEFADPQCPFCREFALKTFDSIVRRYVRPGKVRMELRLVDFLGRDSNRAARALLAAGQQDRLWHATTRFFALQQPENTGYVTDAFLRRVLSGIAGLDIGRAMAARETPDVDQELGAVHSMQSRYGVASTPTLLIGRDVASLRTVSEQTPSPEQIAATIDAELAKTT
jgi:protein-disulfide isomerase